MASKFNRISGIKVIGLTGGIGSGKSTAAGILSGFGAYVIDADEISHEILNKGEGAYCEVVSVFGRGILNSDGSVDRKALASIVFSDEEKLSTLNAITHKFIYDEMNEQLIRCAQERKYEIVILDVPLLFSCDFPIECDRTIAITAKREVKIRRAAERDGADPLQIEERLNNQLSDVELSKLADYCVDNSERGLEVLAEKLRAIYDELTKI